MKPTEIKEFWEECGFEVIEQKTRFEHQVLYREKPTDGWKHLGELKLDPNNLFRHAVPIALTKLAKHHCPPIMKLFQLWYDELVNISGNSSNVEHAAEALFRALYPVITGKTKGRE